MYFEIIIKHYMPGILMITTAFTTSFFKALGLSSVKYHNYLDWGSLAEDAPTGRDLILAAAVAVLAEGALSCKEPPADHLKETEAQERGGSGEEDDR